MRKLNIVCVPYWPSPPYSSLHSLRVEIVVWSACIYFFVFDSESCVPGWMISTQNLRGFSLFFRYEYRIKFLWAISVEFEPIDAWSCLFLYELWIFVASTVVVWDRLWWNVLIFEIRNQGILHSLLNPDPRSEKLACISSNWALMLVDLGTRP